MADWEDGTYDPDDVREAANAAILACDGDLSRERAMSVAHAIFRSLGLTRERDRLPVGVNIPCPYCGQMDGHAPACPLGRKPVDTGALRRSLKVEDGQ